ncbi:MAG: aryl-sulfate sulfotransferase [Flavobacteriales bacterium]|nr:aryl-sulfate sulfotransferase [Flavobacteriales bacterium]
MKRILFLLFCLPIMVSSQVNYTITVNTPDAWQANLFFLRGGTPLKPVKIIDPSITEIHSQNMGMKGWDFKVNYNNKLSYFDRSSDGWFIMDSLQNEVDSVYCVNGYTADNHDFLALANGNYVLFAYDEQPYAMDTVVLGGDPNATVEGLIIQELDANHNLVFQWSSWDHFHVTDNTYLNLTASSHAFIHANAIDIDFDGHFLLSSRGLDEITKIHRTTGEVIWRWGGSQNEFNFINDYPFTHQHSIQSLGNNRYILYDNGNYSAQYTGTINISRAVEYVLDTNLMTAEKVWEFVHPDSLFTPSIGSVQRLPNGNTLIDFGNLQYAGMGSVVTEVDSANNIVFQLEYDNGANLYRAKKFDWFFYTPIPGCTDSNSCNYNPLANTDDGSCYFSIVQINQNGINLEAIVNSGVSPFSFLWNTGETLTTITPQQNGMYWLISTDVNGCVSDTAYFNVTNIPTYLEEINTNKKLLKITDVLGRECLPKKNATLFYIFDDGTVEKKLIINN